MNKIIKTNVAIGIILIVVAVVGWFILFTIKNQVNDVELIEPTPVTKVITKEKPVVSASIESIKNYSNKNGYEIQYPAFFDVDENDSNHVTFYNPKCFESQNILCTGIKNFTIDVTNNEKGINIDQKYKEQVASKFGSCKKIKIFPIPENFNQDELVNAIRCEYPEVPKQEAAGYSYTIIKGDKIFYVNVEMSDSTIVAYAEDEALHTISHETYEALGDLMMRTFKFKN